MPFRYLRPLWDEISRHEAQSRLDGMLVIAAAFADSKNYQMRRVINGWTMLAKRGNRQEPQRKLTKEEWKLRNATLGIEMIGYDD